MTKEQFKTFWANKWSFSLPIPHSFRHDYPERWFRIHSLPESKRYPDNDEEWQTLLDRQNLILTEIIGENAPILLVTGEYHYEGYTELHPGESVDSIKPLSFTQLDAINLHELRPDEYDKGQFYRPSFCKSVWEKNKFDDVLKDIAQDATRVFFLSVDKEIAIAPYDGGIDFILEDWSTRDKYKAKFNGWLSARSDGL